MENDLIAQSDDREDMFLAEATLLDLAGIGAWSLDRVRGKPRRPGRGRVERTAEPFWVQRGVCCCSMYWRRMEIGTPPHLDVWPLFAQQTAGHAFETVHEVGDGELGRVLHQQVNMTRLSHLQQKDRVFSVCCGRAAGLG
jgi:hypothetical protein